jgi:hypothetical protein
VTVISCQKIGQARRRGRLTDQFQREFLEPWRIRVTDPAQDPASVIIDAVSAGLPPMWTPHPTDEDALLSEVTIEEQQTSDPGCWIAGLKYSTDATDQSLENVDPLDELAEFSIDGERVTEAPPNDLDGKTFANSAGEPFDPPPSQERGIEVWEYADNVDDANPHSLHQYRYMANSEVFWGNDIGTMLCTKFRIRRAYRNGVLFWRRELAFKVDIYGDWTTFIVPDNGLNYLVGGVLTPVGAQGQTPKAARFLNGSGGLLNGNGRPTPLPPVNLSFRIRGTADFWMLRLDLPPL